MENTNSIKINGRITVAVGNEELAKELFDVFGAREDDLIESAKLVDNEVVLTWRGEQDHADDFITRLAGCARALSYAKWHASVHGTVKAVSAADGTTYYSVHGANVMELSGPGSLCIRELEKLNAAQAVGDTAAYNRSAESLYSLIEYAAGKGYAGVETEEIDPMLGAH